MLTHFAGSPAPVLLRDLPSPVAYLRAIESRCQFIEESPTCTFFKFINLSIIYWIFCKQIISPVLDQFHDSGNWLMTIAKKSIVVADKVLENMNNYKDEVLNKNAKS
jgi:hypothetical protein